MKIFNSSWNSWSRLIIFNSVSVAEAFNCDSLPSARKLFEIQKECAASRENFPFSDALDKN
jgi:hypothetical protein